MLWLPGVIVVLLVLWHIYSIICCHDMDIVFLLLQHSYRVTAAVAYVVAVLLLLLHTYHVIAAGK